MLSRLLAQTIDSLLPGSLIQSVTYIILGITSIIIASKLKKHSDADTMTTPCEKLDITGISAVLTGQRPLEQYESDDAGDINKQLEKTKANIIESSYQEECYAEGYDPDYDEYKQCSALICHDLPCPFHMLNSIIIKSDDPSSNSILQAITTCGQINMACPEFLVNRYKYLVRVSGRDWTIIKDTIASSCTGGYSSLLACMECMITIYGLKNAQIAQTHVKTIGDMIDELKTERKREIKQKAKDIEFLEQTASQQNTLMRAISECMEKLDQKTLELSRPSSQPASVCPNAPTTRSSSSKQEKLTTHIKLNPESLYQTNDLKVYFNKNLDISITPLTSRGKRFSPLGMLQVKGKTLSSILNLDLDQLGSRLGTMHDFVMEFNKLTDNKDKVAMLNKLSDGIPTPSTGQWVHSYFQSN